MPKRSRVGFREAVHIAWGTSLFFTLPRAVVWWVRGVPDDKKRRAELPTRWQDMSHRGRVAYVVAAVLVAVAIAALAAVVVATEGS